MDAVNLGERTLTGIDFDRLRQLREVQSSFEFSTLLDRVYWRSASGQPCKARVTAVSRIAQFSA